MAGRSQSHQFLHGVYSRVLEISRFCGGSVGKRIHLQCRRCGFDPWVRNPLEEGMATHSSILAWRIPRTEEPGGLQSMGSQRVRRYWRDWAHVLAHTGDQSWTSSFQCDWDIEGRCQGERRPSLTWSGDFLWPQILCSLHFSSSLEAMGPGMWVRETGFSVPLPSACCSLPPTSLAASKASCGNSRRGHRPCQSAVEQGSPALGLPLGCS